MSKYQVYQITWKPRYEKEIQEIYRMYKDQEAKIFDLTFYEQWKDVMEYVEYAVKSGGMFIVKDIEQDDICGFYTFDSNPDTFGDIITKANVHTAIRKKYWGKQSREICKEFLDYLARNYYIKKIIAQVPQCGYGVIKLLKDLDFKHEGTLKQCLLYRDKNGKPKWYDQLIYSLTREDL